MITLPQYMTAFFATRSCILPSHISATLTVLFVQIMLRVCFSDFRLRNVEPEQWEGWAVDHPDLKVLEVEAGRNVKNARVTAHVNSITFDWDSTKDGTVFIKVCVCACVCACVRVCVCACVRVCVKMKRECQTNGKHDKRKSQAQ